MRCVSGKAEFEATALCCDAAGGDETGNRVISARVKRQLVITNPTPLLDRVFPLTKLTGTISPVAWNFRLSANNLSSHSIFALPSHIVECSNLA